MSVTVSTSGSQTTTTTASAYGLVTATAQGVYQFVMNTVNLTSSATADWIEIQVFGQITSTATNRLIDVYTIVGPQSQTFFRTQPYVSPHSFSVFLFHKQFALGSGTDFPWAVYLVT